MTHLDLDESEQHMFQHAADGYGAVVAGGTPDQREETLRDLLDGPFTVVDCREIETSDEFHDEVVVKTGYRDRDELHKYMLSDIDLERGLSAAETTLLILEFDSIDDPDERKAIAQTMKAVAERGIPGGIGYACVEPDAVVKAEFDLSARVKSWVIDEE